MVTFCAWSILREFEDLSDVQVSGPGIDRLRAKVIEMGGRGAPVERNDFGFNHGDWMAFQRLQASGQLDSPSVSIKSASIMLKMLSHYTNTQVPDYREISTLVKRDVDAARAASGSAAPSTPAATATTHAGAGTEKVMVYDRQPKLYNKIKVYIPNGVDRSTMMAINRVVDEKFKQENAPMQVDNYGKRGYPRFKKFQHDKEGGINVYRIHEDIIADIVAILKSKGMEVEYESASSPDEVDVFVGKKVKTDYGNKLIIMFDYDKSKGIYDVLKQSGLMPKAIAWVGSGKYHLNIDRKDSFDSVVEKIKEFGLNVAPLEEFAKSHQFESEEVSSRQQSAAGKGIHFSEEGLERTNQMSVKPNYYGMDSLTKEFVRECIQYTFPEYRWVGEPDFKYIIKGNYKQYITFGKLLKKFGFDVEELRKILKDKIDSGGLAKTSWEGRMDKDEEFMSSIQEKFPESNFELYDEQKFGVAFLYGRDSAILGDSTGLGKCLLPGAKILTNEGVLNIENIWNSFAENIIVNEKGEEWAKLSSEIYVHSLDDKEKIIRSKVVGLYREKIDSFAKEIVTEKGKKIRCTIPHRFYTDHGWDNEITEGDFVCSSCFEVGSRKTGKPLARILGSFFEKYSIPFSLLKIPSVALVTGEQVASEKTISEVLEAFARLKSGVVLDEYLKQRQSKWSESALKALERVEQEDIDNVTEQIETLLNNDLCYERVVRASKIEYKGYVYDLCVEGTENYVANGLVCHNTIQLIKAAELRMKTDPKPTLIVTLKSVQKQFMKEIVNVMGDKEKTLISKDPLQPKKWTVLYYENFSSGGNLEKVIETLANTDFGIVIFDELHKIKHGKTKRSKNIKRVIEKIPTKWGASATVSSNKPMDVKNQLEMIGHHLGGVEKKKFARDFAGAEGFGKSSDKDEREILAAERLNKWLNLSGVYVRREKGEVRDMPEMRIGQNQTKIDPVGFSEMMSNTLSNYKNPNLPVSRLIAAREAISRLKTNETTKKVLDIVSAGEGKSPAASKVVVFTNFVEAAELLVDKIHAGLDKINPEYKVITYLSNTKKKDRDRVKSDFTDDPNIKVLVMSMRMGGTGIDFPNAAQNMVINDFDWTPEAAEQSEGRIYRINTNHPVDITYVVGEGLDKDLFERVKKKREIAAIIQKYRREYHESDDREALKKIIAAQKEIRELDKQMAAKVAAQVPGAEKALQESFRDFLAMISAFLRD